MSRDIDIDNGTGTGIDTGAYPNIIFNMYNYLPPIDFMNLVLAFAACSAFSAFSRRYAELRACYRGVTHNRRSALETANA